MVIQDDFVFKTAGGEKYVINYVGDESHISIPKENQGLPVTVIAPFAFRNGKFKTIEIPDTIREIGYSAFENCGELESIKIPDGITAIRRHTFRDCVSLKRISIPSGVNLIGCGAFSGCSKLETAEGKFKAFALDNRKRMYTIPKDKRFYYEIDREEFTQMPRIVGQGGIHFCRNMFYVFDFYYGKYGKDFCVCDCDTMGRPRAGVGEQSYMSCVKSLYPLKAFPMYEVLDFLNGGDPNEHRIFGNELKTSTAPTNSADCPDRNKKQQTPQQRITSVHWTEENIRQLETMFRERAHPADVFKALDAKQNEVQDELKVLGLLKCVILKQYDKCNTVRKSYLHTQNIEETAAETGIQKRFIKLVLQAYEEL